MKESTKRNIRILHTLQSSIAINNDPKLARDCICLDYQEEKKCILTKRASEKFKRSIKETDLKDFLDHNTYHLFDYLRKNRDLAILVVLKVGLRAIWEKSPFTTFEGIHQPKKLNLFFKKLEDFFCEIAGIQPKEKSHGTN